MNDSLYIAATGMQAQQKNLDTIANNLANLTTPGFKTGRVNFQDMVYRMGQPAGAEGLSLAPSNDAHGTGVSVLSMSQQFTMGEMKKTDGMLDVAISGAGFFEVSLPDGTRAYSRGGALQVNADGFLSSPEGNMLKPGIHIGSDVKSVSIMADGKVMVQANGQNSASEVGMIDMASFSDPAGLTPLGQNLYKPSAKSGEPILGRPGENGVGTLAQGFTEMSNVNMINEMVSLMTAQRAYEMSVKVIQASDEMLAMSNNLRK
ncbi:flagellar basal-body rod protein FlgG [Massilia sp. P8910]|uniref:Flagellar basal-body rod protein FlgG n=1 Tax=Massilia antarctica TaxID=2765360 RepID=A0AA49A7G0_9BURK|nr:MULTISPECIES: flagellar basal-body rod protein FlgG [Massilia]CUI02860.1 Flagellar basal-body rod protein FlgG [Janthinobacterium sp. CG23_2]MCE3602783.1 flagellar basal-body rod protein FlgG [Massilia antarctica]MCY0915668.1 flagellar basal-body rod protein FlgG [Massilia sp. H27-R4]QPI48545.1 flagellar basal-body rod protein FlgG [Massilia antarctica]CUU26646.1 Flagellar basal-body rod protein FlgG [Janthinobacterium sp. CG23_2]